MKKTISLVMALLMSMALFVGCSSESGKTASGTSSTSSFVPIETNIGVIAGPTGMGMAKLMEDSSNGTCEGSYKFSVNSDVSDVLAKVISGEYDMAALPTNSAAVAYAKTNADIQMLALNTYGTLYILQNTASGADKISAVSDLSGKTICTFGQGANPEYVLTYVLENAGLTIGQDVFVDYCPTAAEVLAAAASGEYDCVMLPEPSVTVLQSKNAGFSTVLDMTKEWSAVSGSKLVMGCMVVSKAFAEKNPAAVKKFLEEYESSVAYANSSPEESAALIAKYDIVSSEATALKALPNCNLICITGSDMQSTVEGYYKVLASYNPAAVGGSVPDEAFYYTTK